jgi:hypothetical protein
MFVELGIIGIMLMIFAIVKHYRLIKFNNAPHHESQVMLKAAFWAILVSSLFLSSFWVKSFWLLWMLIVMHRNVYEEKDKPALC